MIDLASDYVQIVQDYATAMGRLEDLSSYRNELLGS
jgi:hypothetical protein